ncbi:MBL fold metallo-hydrolase [Flammeovirga kamogawensis]|uniref:MBL fold metallo-hydrolase n=2 Tax=Flammeovirga kamogawensis TaxID=373891 RepID=A0ABX8GUM0_9BACT|nr:MBL fold metallo-hydrolase [Flammeovirga kamogawensis]QWG07261.1 MBL fold metallo-hydrolase [Flammeovirga kamogawensis]
MKTFFKRLAVLMAIIIAAFLIYGFGFLYLSPEFGGEHSDEDIARYKASGHYNDDGFFNLVPTSLDMSLSSLWETIQAYANGIENSRPSEDIVPNKITQETLLANDSLTRITWFGHSAFLLEIDTKKILVDPMLGQVAAPHPMLGENRYSKELPIAIDQLPTIDAIIISHDHYDHLDYKSIEKLKHKVEEYYVPLGVGAHFRAWGIPSEKIHEMNWWQEAIFKELNIVLTPSRHFSGRGITDRNKTMWGSWVIEGKKQKVFFSGDGGYADHFKEIGKKYGPFDIALMECGQYNKNWAQIHMMPEESAQAAVDVNAKVMMPVHWGAFTLSLHSWIDPVERVTIKAKELDMPLTTPELGEVFIVGDGRVYPTSKWWENY